MIEYYKVHITDIYKIIDNNLYRYDYETKDWKCYTYFGRQYLLKWYDYTPLTLLDLSMLGIPE